MTDSRSRCILVGMKHEVLALCGFYLGAYLLWFTGRMIKADLGTMAGSYIATECLLYMAMGVFASILFLWWLSTTWVQHGISEIGKFGVVFTSSWMVYTFIRTMIKGR